MIFKTINNVRKYYLTNEQIIFDHLIKYLYIYTCGSNFGISLMAIFVLFKFLQKVLSYFGEEKTSLVDLMREQILESALSGALSVEK